MFRTDLGRNVAVSLLECPQEAANARIGTSRSEVRSSAKNLFRMPPIGSYLDTAPRKDHSNPRFRYQIVSAKLLRSAAFAFRWELPNCPIGMGGHLVKIARLLAVAILMFALMVTTRPSVYAQTAPAASGLTKLPQGWDPNIPLPP